MLVHSTMIDTVHARAPTKSKAKESNRKDEQKTIQNGKRKGFDSPIGSLGLNTKWCSVLSFFVLLPKRTSKHHLFGVLLRCLLHVYTGVFLCVIIRVVGTTKYCLAIRLGFNDKSKYSDKARTKTKYTTKDTRKQTYKWLVLQKTWVMNRAFHRIDW